MHLPSCRGRVLPRLRSDTSPKRPFLQRVARHMRHGLRLCNKWEFAACAPGVPQVKRGAWLPRGRAPRGGAGLQFRFCKFLGRSDFLFRILVWRAFPALLRQVLPAWHGATAGLGLRGPILGETHRPAILVAADRDPLDGDNIWLRGHLVGFGENPGSKTAALHGDQERHPS